MTGWTGVQIDGEWADEIRLWIGGHDVTYLRSTPERTQVVTINDYQLQQPYGYGPANFTFPQISELEVDKFGTGDLKWLWLGAPARLEAIKDGAVVDVIWRGFYAKPTITRTLSIQCDGDASGRLQERDVQPALKWRSHDVGLFVFDAFKDVGLPMTPRLGPTTGINVTNQGGDSDYLAWVDSFLSLAMTDDGDQWTVMPKDNTRRMYEMRLKDRTTIAATVFCGAPGVEPNLSDDIHEHPTTFYGHGKFKHKRDWKSGSDGSKHAAPSGSGYWNNAIHPMERKAPAPDFPMPAGQTMHKGTTNADTTTGVGVTVLHNRLLGTGDLTREELGGGLYDDDTTDAVKHVQKQAGLAQTGTVNQATWDAIFDVTVTGRSHKQDRIMPLYEEDRVQKWLRTDGGAIFDINPGWDPNAVEVDRTVDHGTGISKEEARRWSRREHARLSGKQWAGTITLTTDAMTGDYHHGDVGGTPFSRWALRPGQNLMYRGFDGDTLLHIAGVDANPGDGTVTLTVDTLARDLLTIAEIRQRNREASRKRHRREMRRLDRSDHVRWNEQSGRLSEDRKLDGGKWNIVKIRAADEGIISSFRFSLRNAKAECAVVVAGRELSRAGCAQHLGNPLRDTGRRTWMDSPSIQDWLDRHDALFAAGDYKQPGGYWPRKKTDDQGATGAPITGDFRHDSNWKYRTEDSAMLYVAIYVDRDCVLQAGRLMTRQGRED